MLGTHRGISLILDQTAFRKKAAVRLGPAIGIPIEAAE